MTAREMYQEYKRLLEEKGMYKLDGIDTNSNKAMLQNGIDCLNCTDKMLNDYLVVLKLAYPNTYNKIANNGDFKKHSFNRLYVFNTARSILRGVIMKQKSYKYAWCDLSPSVGNEACGIRFCEILKVLENELIVVLPYFFNGKEYVKMEQHQRTISIHRIKEKTNKIPKTHLIKKPPQNYDNVLKEFLEIERMFLNND